MRALLRKSNCGDPGGQRVIVSSRFLSAAARKKTQITLIGFEVQLCVCVVLLDENRVGLFLDFRVFCWLLGSSGGAEARTVIFVLFE